MFSLAGASKRIYCPVPRPLLNGTITGSRVSVSASIKYKCDEKFELKGPELRVCQRNGKWSRENPHCQPKCKLAGILTRNIMCFKFGCLHFYPRRLPVALIHGPCFNLFAAFESTIAYYFVACVVLVI